MALIGNRSVLHKSPGRFLNGNAATGGAIANLRSNGNKHGMSRNAFEVFDATAAQPYGYYGGRGAWVQPRKGGAVSGVNANYLTFGASGNGSMGRNIDGAASLTFGLTGTGGLISSATGVASLSLGASGNLFASKAASGTATLSLGATGQIKAIGHITGAAPISFAAAWQPYAIGWLSGTTAEAGLTTTGIANAVWGAVAAANNDSGTMGQKLNSAASGGVDYGSMADAVRTELSAELARIIEIAKIHGLVIGSDLVVTTTTRTAGDISQSVSESAGIVTVSRA